LRVALARLVRVHSAHVGLEGEGLGNVERLAGDDVDGTGDAAFHQIRFRTLVNDD
jgi:hypothetical protein